MRKFWLICAGLLIFSSLIRAQDDFPPAGENYENFKKAQKIDEFGRLGHCDVSARLDMFLVELQNNPGHKGVIIVYEATNALPASYGRSTDLYRNHINFRRFDASRVEIIGGSFRNERTTELWLVPPGAETPKPTETLPQPALPKEKTFLYDLSGLVESGDGIGDFEEGDGAEEFLLDAVKARREAERREYEQENSSEELPDETAANEDAAPETDAAQPEQISAEELEEAKFQWVNRNFGELIKERKDARGVLIFYADNEEYDIAKIQSHIEQGRRRLAEAAEISIDKVQIIFGGYRGWIQAEFWIVPKNGEIPAAKPEERPVEEQETQADSEVRE